MGEPDLTHCSSTSTVSAVTYQAVKASISVISPYKQACKYKIKYTLVEPVDCKAIKWYDWSKEKSYLIPRRLFCKESLLTTDEYGRGYLEFVILCMTTNIRTFWVFCRNENFVTKTVV